MEPDDILVGKRYLNDETGEVRSVIKIDENEMVEYWIESVPSPLPHKASLEDFAAWADAQL